MDSKDSVILTQNALKLVCDVEDNNKEDGLNLLEQILGQKHDQLVFLGYDLVIFKELIKMVQFERGVLLRRAASLLEAYYYKPQHLDELAETLIYKVARSTDREVCQLCLEKIFTLVDSFDESIAKHSKQLLKLADMNDLTDLNPIISDILEKMKTKLPKRRNV